MKNMTDACMIAVFKEIYEYLKERNCKPKLHVTDNECSKEVKTFIKDQGVPIQLIEPGNHRVNAAKMGVKTGKYHLISSLATAAKSIPIQLWCQYMTQIEMKLNMLRTCRQYPTISTYKALNGPFDYNKTPLAPLGSPAVLYDDPTNRNTFAPHCTDAIYVAPPMLHYCNRKYWVPSTQKMRISSSERIYPEHCEVPTILEADKTLIAASDLLTEMQSAVPHTAKAKLRHAKALKNLTAIIENTPTKRETPTATPTVSTSTDATSPRVI